MNIDRYMVNLFFEIKRNIPIHQHGDMKISNPNIGKVMLDLYKATDDENIKLLTRIFLERAGDSWIKEADKKTSVTATLIKKLTRENVANNVLSEKSESSRGSVTKAKRIYRGQIVED